jgi:ABC-type dipeptide/oligopeptide/nickel transport system permease component
VLRYIVRRVLLSIPVLFGVITIVFVVIRILPGDPAATALGDYASKEAVATLRQRLGLDQPLPLQYAAYVGALMHGDLGRSMITGSPVADQIQTSLPYTLELTAGSLVLGVVMGIAGGAYMAARSGRWPDKMGRALSAGGQSLPAFFLGVLLALLFAVRLRVLPALSNGSTETFQQHVASLVLPTLTLALIVAASMARLARVAVLNIIHDDYVRTARAKGLSRTRVQLDHTLRPALIPVVSLAGFWAVSLIGDSVTTELVFARPGLGKLMVGAMLQKDYTTLESTMVVYTFMVVGINLLVELVYGVVDPRARRRA